MIFLVSIYIKMFISWIFMVGCALGIRVDGTIPDCLVTGDDAGDCISLSSAISLLPALGYAKV